MKRVRDDFTNGRNQDRNLREKKIGESGDVVKKSSFEIDVKAAPSENGKNTSNESENRRKESMNEPENPAHEQQDIFDQIETRKKILWKTPSSFSAVN